MVYAAAYNTTDGPVIIDGAGRTLGGRSWGPVETNEDAVTVAIDEGRLVCPKRPAKSADVAPEAAAAFAAVDDLEKARKAGDVDAEVEAVDEHAATPSKRARRARQSEEN